MTSEGNRELVSLIDQLIEEANTLFSTIIEKTKSSDSRSKLQQSQWTERHRLNVLLEVAQETRKNVARAKKMFNIPKLSDIFNKYSVYSSSNK